MGSANAALPTGIPNASPIPGTYGSLIPGAQQYLSDNLTAKQAYSNALARINQQRQSTLGQYGYQGTVNPTSGVISNVSVNPNAPYGLYQQMLRSGAQAGEQAAYGLQDRGIHGGLANQAQTLGRYNFGADSVKLGQGLSDMLFQLQDQQDSAKYTYDQALAAAQAEAAANAIQSGGFDPTWIEGPNDAPQQSAPAPTSSQARLVTQLLQKAAAVKPPVRQTQAPRSSGGSGRNPIQRRGI